MRRLTIVFLLALASACQRGVCESDAVLQNPRQTGPIWAAHRDLIPPGTVVCGYAANPSLKSESLNLEYEAEPQTPMVALSELFEKHGWQRRQQKRQDDSFEVTFASPKGDAKVIARGLFSKKRTNIDLTWASN